MLLMVIKTNTYEDNAENWEIHIYYITYIYYITSNLRTAN